MYKRAALFSIILLLVCLLVVPLTADAVESAYESVTVEIDGGVVPIQMVVINMESEGLRVHSLTDSSGERIYAPSPVRSVQSYVDQVDGFAAVNGSYFCPSDYSSCAGKEGSFYWMWYDSPSGNFANFYQNQFNNGPVIAFDENNGVHYFRVAEHFHGREEFEADTGVGLQAAISNGPGLVFEDELVVTPGQLDKKQATVKSARSFIGFKGGNVYIGTASSATVMDLGYAVHALGMENAMNLDGGGSSALYYNGQFAVGPGRLLPNALVFSSSIGITEPPDPDAISVAPGAAFFTYDESLRGGYQITSGNVREGEADEIISGTGDGMGPHVQVFDREGNVKTQFFAYHESVRYGVTVSACDVNGDGYDEIVTAQGPGGWPLVKIFDGYGNVINDGFTVLDGEFLGGVHLSCGDTDGDGVQDIVVAARQGGGPHVLVYNLDGRILTNFMAYDEAFRGGINVATLDFDGDGKDEIVTGPHVGAPHVQIFQIRTGVVKRLSPGFYAFSSDYRGGVQVAGVDTDGDGGKELLVGVGSEAQPLVKRYNVREELLQQFYAFGTNFLGGVMVAGGDVDADGLEEILVVPRSGGGPNVRIINAEAL